MSTKEATSHVTRKRNFPAPAEYPGAIGGKDTQQRFVPTRGFPRAPDYSGYCLIELTFSPRKCTNIVLSGGWPYIQSSVS